MENRELQQYAILMSYLECENTVLWTRGSLFLVGTTALLGFVTSNLPTFEADTRWEKALSLVAMSGVGLALTYLWQRCLMSSLFWIDHWHSLLRQIEPAAFGDLRVLRDLPPKGQRRPYVSAKRVLLQTVYLFYVLWTPLVLYAFFLLGSLLA